MARSRISIAKGDIVKLFDESAQRVYTKAQLDEILADNRQFWRLAQSTTVHKFIEYLVSNSKLKRAQIKLPHRPTNRYLWGEPSIYEIVQSLRPNGYFSHYTALALHGLTDQIPKTIYINSEQQATGGGGELSQKGIDLAFKRKCRTTSNRTVFMDTEIVAVNGRNTGQLGITEIEDGPARLRVTDIERTLIDATVRPIYSGGTTEVANAFRIAHGKFSVNQLVSYLKKLMYTYPYHQAIGYYLDRARLYSETQLSLLSSMGTHFDFYLANAMESPKYNEKWRLFVPQSL